MDHKITWVKPEEIEARSMELIEQEMPSGSWSWEERQVVRRCIHTSADFDYAKNLYFSQEAVEHALQVLKKGGFTIVTDTNMAASGINKRALAALHGQVRCFMADADVDREAKERGITRAAVSMEHAAALSGPLMIASGNAPTALIRLNELMAADRIHPEIVIAVPVGFVNVIESKEAIICSGVPCIVARGRKGGSNIAAAICNALMYLVTGYTSVG